MLAKHARYTHTACVSCHTDTQTLNRWSRQICATCHVRQASGHYATKACDDCHQIPTMGAR